MRSEASGSSSSASSSQASENRGASENVVTSEPEDSQTTAPADEENEQTRPAAEENPEPTSDVRTVTLPRGVYVESHGEDDEAAQETSEPENADNPYAISAVSETDGYAMAEGDNTSDDYPDNGGGGDEPDYELNQRNMIVVRGEDFAAAFDIICQYASESYSNYFMVTSDNIDIMLAALDDAGVQYHDNIAVDTDKITFRISIG